LKPPLNFVPNFAEDMLFFKKRLKIRKIDKLFQKIRGIINAIF